MNNDTKDVIQEALIDYQKNRITANGFLVIIAGIVLPLSLSSEDLRWAENQIYCIRLEFAEQCKSVAKTPASIEEPIPF